MAYKAECISSHAIILRLAVIMASSNLWRPTPLKPYSQNPNVDLPKECVCCSKPTCACRVEKKDSSTQTYALHFQEAEELTQTLLRCQWNKEGTPANKKVKVRECLYFVQVLSA